MTIGPVATENEAMDALRDLVRAVNPQHAGRETKMNPKKRGEKQKVSAKPWPPVRAKNKFLAERARLEKQVFWIIGWLGRKQVELGQIFLRLKATCKHGEWEEYYEEIFGHSLSLRTAERYMKRASKVNSDSLSILKPGTDQHAVNINKATERARAETGVSTEQKPEPVYRLALRLSEAQRGATISLWKSPHRARAEKEVVAVLERLLIEYRFISSNSLKSIKQEARHENTQA
jgi:hypothetical protein